MLAELGFVAGRVEESVTARTPTPDEREALQLGDGTPVLALSRLVLSTDDQPIEACIMTMVNRNLRYRMRLH
ncbi:UTRA domain-containing protein [Streptomyces stramineus]|uniref:UTRA domain-containing protein n=1 Tax=Streptomyces TaxID=1883 RepID=UPI0033DB7D7C